MRKQRAQVDAAISLVCAALREWDPIGVFPDCPVDEYDSYAPHIVTLLRSGANQTEIADELERIRTQPIGLPPNRPRDEEIARGLLIEWSLAQPGRSNEAPSR
jgi:hypothetical protein